MSSIMNWSIEVWIILSMIAFVQCAILYFIIKWAVQAGTKDLKRELELQKRMTAKMLMNNGVSRKDALDMAYRTDIDL